jgi:hypothetical protein
MAKLAFVGNAFSLGPVMTINNRTIRHDLNSIRSNQAVANGF